MPKARPEPVRDRAAMIAGMRPRVQPGRFHFCTVPDDVGSEPAQALALASFHEAEGLSVILAEPDAAALGLGLEQPMAQITLMVHSALDGVGLTAAVAAALAEAGIPCNMVAAFHHDHAFVPHEQADRALAILTDLAARG